MSNPSDSPSDLLPPTDQLRSRLAVAMREVDILNGLLRLSEQMARKDGRPARRTPHHPVEKVVARAG